MTTPSYHTHCLLVITKSALFSAFNRARACGKFNASRLARALEGAAAPAAPAAPAPAPTLTEEQYKDAVAALWGEQ